jgi:hypothetical protein
MLNTGSEDSWDMEGSAQVEPSASEEALAEVMLLGETYADTDAQSLQEHVGKLTDWLKERKMALNKVAECLKVEGRALISDAKKRSTVIVQDAKNEADSIAANSESILREAENEAETFVAVAVEETKKWEAEKTALAGVQHFEPIVKLDVGGVRVTTSLTTLCRFPDTMIGCMFSGRHTLPQGEDGYFFIDRDGTHFRHILNFLRSPESYKPVLTAAEKEELLGECK